MSGSAFEKKINALERRVVRQKNPNVETFEKYTLENSMKKRLWLLNNIMFCFHTAFVAVTLSVGTLDLNATIYKLTLSPNATISNIQNVSMYTTEEANVQVPDWKDGLDEFLKVGTKKQNFSLPLTWVVATFFFLSAFFHFCNANIWWRYYIFYLEKQQSPFRWIEYTFSASVMILVVSYAAGVRIDIDLFMLFVLIATTMFFGHLTEVINQKSKTGDEWTLSLRQRLTPHLMGYFPQVSAWFVILYIFSESSKEAPDFVWAILLSQLVLFFSFGLVQLVVILRPPSKYVQGEVVYQWLSFVCKGFLGTIMIINVVFLGNWSCIVNDIKNKLPSDYC